MAVTPERAELAARVRQVRHGIADRLRRKTVRYRRELELLRARPVLSRPELLLAERRQRGDEVMGWVRHRLSLRQREVKERLARAREILAALSPEAVLKRGYSITRLADGTVVRSARQLAVGSAAEVVFAEGSAEVDVRKTNCP